LNIFNVKIRITYRNSQVVGFSVILQGGTFDTVLHSTRVPLYVQETTDLNRKCARHLRGRYARSVLTFLTRQVCVNLDKCKRSEANFEQCVSDM
jgi:hypothetical protein